MPLGALVTPTCVATFSACQSSICALLAIELYSRRERPGMMQAAQTGRRGGSFFGIPAGGFNLCTSVLLSFAAGFLAFFGSTCVAIFALLAWNLGGRHAVNYADSYLYVGLPAGVIVLFAALAVFLTLWARANLKK